ncbi:MAG: hypothetical protein R3D43_08725 [Tepidamorphaceae bacterium]
MRLDVGKQVLRYIRLMRGVFSSLKFRGSLGACAIALTVVGCSNPVTQGIGNASSDLAQRLSLSSSNQNQEPIPPAERPEIRACPRAVVRDGTQTLRSFERGAEGDPQFIRYQGEILKVARECTYSGDEIVSVKFGVSGRVVLGPRGAPDTFTLPIRAVFLPRGGAPAWGELYKQTVTVNPGETSADFVMVQQTPAISLKPGEKLTDYTVFVGFDEKS